MNDNRRFDLAALTLVVGLGLAPAFARAADDDDGPKLAGMWTWSWTDTNGKAHHHVLEVEGLGTKLAAREQFDDEAAVRVADLKLDGKKIRFTVVRGPKRTDYSGVVADSKTINGTVTVTIDGQSTEFPWKAKREPEKGPAQKTPPPEGGAEAQP